MSGLVMPPPAAREMRAPHLRTPLPEGTVTTTWWVWLLAVTPWLFASTVFLFEVSALIDALWIGDPDAALAHVAVHLAVLAGSTLASVAAALTFAFLDHRTLRRRGVARPFPWGFAAIASLVYLIGRHVVLRSVTRPNIAPLVVSITLSACWYSAFAVWGAWSVSSALGALSTAG